MQTRKLSSNLSSLSSPRAAHYPAAPGVSPNLRPPIKLRQVFIRLPALLFSRETFPNEAQRQRVIFPGDSFDRPIAIEAEIRLEKRRVAHGYLDVRLRDKTSIRKARARYSSLASAFSSPRNGSRRVIDDRIAWKLLRIHHAGRTRWCLVWNPVEVHGPRAKRNHLWGNGKVLRGQGSLWFVHAFRSIIEVFFLLGGVLWVVLGELI